MPVLLALAGCASVYTAPSLAPRPAETIDPRVPMDGAASMAPVDPALAARLNALVAQARSGNDAFQTAAAAAERLVAAAGRPGSESWISAQEALSVAVAARAPTTGAMGDIDALAANMIATRGGIAPADQAAIEAAADAVGAIDRSQASRIDAMQARLRG